jgi:predicted ATP-dependent endonuclease of OLD family
MMIIADIISYMEKYPESSFNSQINLISIEEPETFMHPQMQELFIKNVNEMISSLLEDKNKHVNSQIIITTHSPHILNSKIHEGNTFDKINYITTLKNVARATCLSDKILMSAGKTNQGRWKKEQNLKFLKQHVKFKVSELFFADAVIFVEGITEYTLLQYYLDADSCFNKHYISLILINGAHTKVYENLIYALGVPTLIITDIDIKREKFEKYEKDEKNSRKQRRYLQMDSKNIGERSTTNSTLAHFYKNSVAREIIAKDYQIIDNLMIVCQKQEINGFYPTSFEEAFMLTNSKNEILNVSLKKVKPDIYKEIGQKNGIIKNSYKLQKKLSDAKSDFANQVLFEIVTRNDKSPIPDLPQYIKDGLQFLQDRLEGNLDEI